MLLELDREPGGDIDLDLDLEGGLGLGELWGLLAV